MHIQSLGIKNFRCFEDAEFTFHPTFNVILGGNASGKTALLEALREVLRIFIQGHKHDYVTAEQIYNKTYLVSNDINSKFIFLENSLRVKKEKEIILSTNRYIFKYIENLDGKLDFNLRTDSGVNLIKLFGYVSSDVRMSDNINNDELFSKFSIFAYYSTMRLCNDPNSGVKTSDTPDLTRFSGYDNSLFGGFSIGNLRQWFEYEDRIEYTEKKESTSFRILKNAMIKMLEGATEITYDPRSREIFIHQEDGRIVSFAQLSDGQRSLLTLAGDLAMRIIRLNPFDDALETTPGVVLIDELDLHLHPRWQRQVVHSLQRVFPKVQFIVTTHSPTIISEVPPECIILLGPDGKPQQVRQAYGLDNNTIMESIMGAKSRPSKVQEAIGAIEDKIDDKQYQEARHLLDKLEIELKGTDAELVGLRASLATLEALEDFEEDNAGA
jgi:predicted ATP-binding protein involved in virulence